MARLLTLLALLGITLRAHGTPIDAVSAAKSSYCANVCEIRGRLAIATTDMCRWQFDDLPQNTGGFDPSIDPVGTYKGTYKGDTKDILHPRFPKREKKGEVNNTK